jgi:hypothetical protein
MNSHVILALFAAEYVAALVIGLVCAMFSFRALSLFFFRILLRRRLLEVDGCGNISWVDRKVKIDK